MSLVAGSEGCSSLAHPASNIIALYGYLATLVCLKRLLMPIFKHLNQSVRLNILYSLNLM